MVLKGAELEEGDPNRKYKYRVGFQSDNVVGQGWPPVIFQDLGPAPASMEAGGLIDFCSCTDDNGLEQADAAQACVQAGLEGRETWAGLPGECLGLIWGDGDYKQYPHLFWDKDGIPLHNRPCLRFIGALYGHLGAGSCWEGHCDKRMGLLGFKPAGNWPPMYFHDRLGLVFMIYVRAFTVAGPRKDRKEGWGLIRFEIGIGDPAPPGLSLGCVHEHFSYVTKEGGEI